MKDRGRHYRPRTGSKK